MKKIKWLVLAGLFGMALWFASNYGGNIPYMLLEFVAAVPIVAVLYTLWVTFHFRFFQKVDEITVVKGEPVNYFFCISNESRFFYDSIRVKFHEDYSRLIGVSEESEYHLLPGEVQKIDTRLCCNYRGEYAVGANAFEINDYLHLITLHYKNPSPLKLLVLPRVVPWEFEQEILSMADGRNTGGGTKNGDLDVQVRNYVTGDAMRMIHWKATARNAKLMAREQYENRRQEMVIFFDLEEKTKEQELKFLYEDEMIEQLVAAVNACRKRSIPCNVFMNSQGMKNYHVESEKQWNDFYRTCGKLQFREGQGLEKMKEMKPCFRNASYAVVYTNRMTENLIKNFQTEFTGIETSVVLVHTGELSGEEVSGKSTAQIQNINIFHVILGNRGEKNDIQL